METWEALDVDDSDLASLLRPCKRRHEAYRNPSTLQSQPNVTPSSHLSQSHPSQTLDSTQLSQPHPSQTLDCFSQQFHSAPPPTISSPLIPGPAGAVQAAMLRKSRDMQNFSNQETPIPTQEYIRRAVEDAEEDDDFKRNPWLCAIEFVSGEGTVDGVIPSAPLSSIKKCRNIGKVDQVVAVIKSCTPTDLGDLMVTLKDPTCTVCGTIHHKVLAEGEFSKDISVGSVLILQKVSVFAPSRSARYLNITLSNVVKVFCKDSGPPLKQNYHACAVKYAAPDSECDGETRILQKAFSIEQERTEGVMNEIKASGLARESLHIDKQPFPGSAGRCSNQSSIHISQNAATGKEPLLGRQGATKEIFKAAVRTTITEETWALGNNDKWLNGGNLSGSLKQSSLAANLVENHNEKESQRVDAIQKQREPITTRVSLPQWTEEQLKELFADAFEDDGSLL